MRVSINKTIIMAAPPYEGDCFTLKTLLFQTFVLKYKISQTTLTY